jgi:hypothetical protein
MSCVWLGGCRKVQSSLASIKHLDDEDDDGQALQSVHKLSAGQ